MALFTTDGQIGALKDVLVAAINGRVKKSGDTMTGPLTAPSLKAIGSGSDIKAYGPGGGLRWAADDSGKIFLQEITSAGDITRSLFSIAKGATSVANFYAHPIAAGKPTAAGQVPQLNAYDPATGRRLVDGVEEGWTGARDISSLVTADYTVSTPVILRRDGNIVKVGGRLQAVTGGTKGAFVLTNGFRDSVTSEQYFHSGSNTSAHVRASFAGGTTFVPTMTAGQYIEFSLTLISADAWPSFLPGLAIAGSTPYQLPAAA